MNVPVLVGGVVVSLAVGFSYAREAGCVSPSHLAQTQVLRTWLVGSVVWSALYLLIVEERVRPHSVVSQLGFAWPLLMAGIEMTNVSRVSVDAMRSQARHSLQMDSNALTGISFAILGVIGSTMGKERAVKAAPLFGIAILSCLLFVLPSPSFTPISSQGVVFATWQKVSLSYAIGLLISGVSILITPQTTEENSTISPHDTQ